MNHSSRRALLILLLSVVSVPALCCSIAVGQSGRRVKRPEASPAPPPIQPEPEPSPTPRPSVPRQKLIVGMDTMGQSMNIPNYMSNAVWDGLFAQFRKHSSVAISADTNMRSKEARERAKKETESFVVLLQLDTEYMSSGSGTLGQANPDDLVVSYTIYAPGTGKTRDTGRVYVRQSRRILSMPTIHSGEAQLNQAGRDTADRIMSSLHMGGIR